MKRIVSKVQDAWESITLIPAALLMLVLMVRPWSKKEQRRRR